MPRSRSRSPRRDRKRSRSRSHSRERTRRRRSRSRSRSPRRRRRSDSRDSPRTDQRSKGNEKGWEKNRKFVKKDIGENEEMVFTKVEEPDVTETEGKTEDEVEMMKLMGFSNFDTTKDKQVIGNDLYCANIVRKRRYRQYMNRKGGFNRPLDAIA